MRGDDAVGPLLAKKLTEIFRENSQITVLNAKTVPENFTGLIKRENPSHLILLDAVEMNKNPGHIKLVQKDEIVNYSISTHAMPVSFLIKYLETSMDAKMLLIGIQPKNMEMNAPVSKEVESSINKLSNIMSML